jgi:cardiolipin synthase
VDAKAPISAAADVPRAGRYYRAGPFRADSDSPYERLLEIANRAGLHLSYGRGLDLIHRGDQHFVRLIDELSAASREICIEMYQVLPDPIGWRLCSALASAAARGVSVRLLLDRFGSSAVGAWFETLERYGVQVRWYRPWRAWSNPFLRTHRKLIVIDGHRASIGGINMAADFSEAFSKERAWRDLALWIEGPTAWILRRQFEAAWEANGGPPGPPLPVPDGSGTLCALSNTQVAGSNQADAYLALIASAHEEILLATPYFLPDARLQRALADAVQRGVTATVVVPRRSDIWWFKHGSRHLYRRLLQAGVWIWERCDRMVHAKVAAVDGRVAAIGSTNLNRLSFYGNSETLLLTAEPRIVAEIRSMIRDESLAAAERVTARSWRSHPDRRPWAELAASAVAVLL